MGLPELNLHRASAEIQSGLQYVFQTDSPYTTLMSGSGHAGMEAVIANLLEPGETIVVGNHGIWGERVIDLSQRYGGGLPSAQTHSSNASLAFSFVSSDNLC